MSRKPVLNPSPELIASVAGFLARMFPQLEKAKASKANAPDSGTSSSASTENSNPTLSGSKTSRRGPGAGSKKSGRASRKTGTQPYRLKLPPGTWERLTDAIESSSSESRKTWATPCASDGIRGSHGSQGRQGGLPLNEQVVEAMNWPTPTAALANKACRTVEGARKEAVRKCSTNDLMMAVLLWPTPCASDSRASGRVTTTTGVMHDGVSLTDATVRAEWPTPTAQRYGTRNNGSPQDGCNEYATKGSPSLDTMAVQQGGQLNADWVEMLMGFPPDWSNVPKPAGATLGGRRAAAKSNSATNRPG